MEIVYRKLSELKPNPKNPRKATKEAIEKLARSISENPKFFEARPILLSDRTGELVIIGGEQRSKAAAILKMETVPTILIPGLDKAGEDEVLFLDNTHSGVWDEQKLAKWDKGQLKQWNVDGVKWPKEPIQAKEDNFDPDKKVKSRVKRGDIWQLGRHRLMCGDSTKMEDVQKLTGGVMADLLMTDPPYGINAEKMTMGDGKKQFYRGKDWDNSRPDLLPFFQLAKYHCFWGGNYFSNQLDITNDWLCWYKNSPNTSFSEFELAWTDYKHNCRLITHHWSVEEKLHVTMKPLAVICWAIEKCPNEPKTIIDVFCGSGTTIIASEQMGMKCFGMEIDPHYCDVIITRWEQFTGKKAKKLTA